MTSKALAIAAREIRERWLLLAGGLALGFVPLVPPAFGLSKEGWGVAGLLFAVLIGGMTALLAGWSMLARDADDGRLAFLLGKPVSWPAIWSGKWVGACLLAGAAGLLAALPWMAVYPPETKASWFSTWDAQGWTFAISMIVLIVGLANFASTAFRARSAWLVVDFALLLAAVWAVRHFVAPLAMIGVIDLTSGWGLTFLTAVVAVAILGASAAQLAFGRTDLRRAHRALSVTFWVIVFAWLAAAAGRFAWVERATPADLRVPYLVRPAPDGRWVYIEGTTNRGGWYSPRLLVDSVSGRYLRTVNLGRALEQDQDPGVGFSADGLFAVKWSGVNAATRLSLLDLRAVPPRVTEVALEASAPPSWLTAVCPSAGAETALVIQQGSASLVALPSGRSFAATSLPPGWRVAAARLPSASAARLWLALGEWGPATPVRGPAQFLVVELAANASPRTVTVPTEVRLSPTKDEIVASGDGGRLLTLERGLVLRNGADGAVIARLMDGARPDAARFLADGRIVALSREGNRRILRTFDADGSLARRSELDLGLRPTTASLGPEVRPGQVVITAGVPFLTSDSLIVEVPDGRVVERLAGLRPAPTRLAAGDVQARSAQQPAFPPGYFVGGSGQVVRIDFATGERRVVTGPGAPEGERLKGL
jgi:hypothetical protein